jgi:hypothetical protein
MLGVTPSQTTSKDHPKKSQVLILYLDNITISNNYITIQRMRNEFNSSVPQKEKNVPSLPSEPKVGETQV